MVVLSNKTKISEPSEIAFKNAKEILTCHQYISMILQAFRLLQKH